MWQNLLGRLWLKKGCPSAAAAAAADDDDNDDNDDHDFTTSKPSAHTDYDGTSKVQHRRDRAATSSSLLFGIQHIQEFLGAKK
jgi:hypothetical protein